MSQSVLLSPTVSSIRTALENGGRGDGGDCRSQKVDFIFSSACTYNMHARKIDTQARAQGFEFSFFDGVRVREELKSGFRI